MKKTLACIMAVLMLAAMAAGCGTAPQQAAATPAPEAAPTPQAETAAPEATQAPEEPAPADEGGAASALDRIRANGKLIMLTNAAFPPFEYLGADNTVHGVDAEIAQAIADAIGVELVIEDMDFDGIVMAIQTGKGDIGVAAMTATEERRKNIDFSIDYLSTTQLIIVKDGSDIKTAADLEGKAIGVQLGTTGDLFASEYITGAQVSGFKTGADAGMALANGQVDAVIIDEMPASQIVSANDGLVVLEEPLTEEQYAIAIAKGNDDLKTVIDEVLGQLLADGTIDALIEKHMAAAAAE